MSNSVLGTSNVCTAATPTREHGSATRKHDSGATRRHGGSISSRTSLRALGFLGLVCVLVSLFWLCAGAAQAPWIYVPGRSGGWPGWMAGPLRNIGLELDQSGFQTLTLIMAGGYLAALASARVLPLRTLAFAILGANVILLLGPPLISQDVFGYIGYARLGALHGLNPYTSFPAQAPTDPVFHFLGWPYQHSPYGPLFTLGSYTTAPLGVAGALWAFKTVAVLSSLGAVALVGIAAKRMGSDPRFAVAFVGLNPVLLELAVGGAHNDTLVMLLLALALALTASAVGTARAPRTRGPLQSASPQRAAANSATPSPPHNNLATVSLVAAVGVKASAGLVLPYLVLSPPRVRGRARLLAVAIASLALVALIGAIGFGGDALGFLGALHGQQQMVATHSIPAETARLLGLTGTPTWWRNVYLGGFLLVLALTLLRTWRGADWRAQAGWATLALLLATAWLLPWYAIWALPLAALGASRRLRVATLVFCAYALLIHLPLAKPLLSPPRNDNPPQRAVKAAGLQDLQHVHQIHAGRHHD